MIKKTIDNRKKAVDERGLVGRILRGEKLAFERFYQQHKLVLEKYIESRIGNNSDAEEIAQDTFLSFLDSLPLYSFRSNLKTFLYSICKHEIADYFRRKYAKRALRVMPIVGEFVDERLYSTGELSQQIEMVYRRLLPEYTLILRMKYEEGLSVQAIARKLKLSVKAAESKLFRARKAFQVAYSATSD